jgi:hypothetical protein
MLVNPKVLVILLVVIVVLFVVGLGVGLGRDDGSAALDLPSWGDTILQGLAPQIEPQAILPVTSGCLKSGGVIVAPPGRTCTVEIQGAWWPVRTLTVELEEGVSARLLLEHLGERERISPNPALPDKDGETQVALSVLRDGARLHVTCQGDPSADACQLALAGDGD